MPDRNTAAAASFQNADAYEQVMGRWSLRLAPLPIRFGGLSDGDRVLDVGCGTGSLAFTLPEIANVAEVTGVDLVEAFVEFARAHNTDPRITFKQADARALPLSWRRSIARAAAFVCMHGQAANRSRRKLISWYMPPAACPISTRLTCRRPGSPSKRAVSS
jgi:SAM-dependent methyltransferase